MIPKARERPRTKWFRIVCPKLRQVETSSYRLMEYYDRGLYTKSK